MDQFIPLRHEIYPSTIQIVDVGDVRLTLTRPIIQNKCSVVKQYLFSVENQERNDQGARAKMVGFRQSVATGRDSRGSGWNDGGR